MRTFKPDNFMSIIFCVVVYLFFLNTWQNILGVHIYDEDISMFARYD